MIRKLSFQEAKSLLDSRPDAVLLPVDELTDETAMDAIPELTTPVLVYCRSGFRSNVAAHRLEEFGYREIYDLGSLIGWPYGLE